MKYKCKICGFIHEGEIPDGYYCPLCYATKFDFELIEEIKKEYKRVYVDPESPSHARIDEKCINCGACSNTCFNIVNIKYKKLDEPICINCGQCILSCPTGALVPKYQYNEVFDLIKIPENIVVAITSPAIRVSLGDAFDIEAGEFLEGKMIASLKALGFDYVFDTSFGADLATMEEVGELKHRIANNGLLPMFTGCCPSWYKYARIYYHDLINHISTCKTPIGAQATIIKNIFAKEEEINKSNIFVVAITPCTAKKDEITNTDCDYVLTTSEIALALREKNIDFNKLTDMKFDTIIGSTSGTLYGTTGGVTLSVLRTFYHSETGNDMPEDLLLIKDKEFYKEYSIKINKKTIKAASVYMMANLEKLLPLKDSYTFIEVMNCNMGCIGGGGQVVMPVAKREDILSKRDKGLQKNDLKAKLRYPYNNPEIIDLYENHLDYPYSEKSKKILHTTVEKKSE